jgi:hypothetical protein
LRRSAQTDAFQNGTIIASSVKTVLLTSLDSTNNDDKLGIIADVAIDAVVQSGFIVSLVEGDAVSRQPRRQGEQAD